MGDLTKCTARVESVCRTWYGILRLELGLELKVA